VSCKYARGLAKRLLVNVCTQYTLNRMENYNPRKEQGLASARSEIPRFEWTQPQLLSRLCAVRFKGLYTLSSLLSVQDQRCDIVDNVLHLLQGALPAMRSSKSASDVQLEDTDGENVICTEDEGYKVLRSAGWLLVAASRFKLVCPSWWP